MTVKGYGKTFSGNEMFCVLMGYVTGVKIYQNITSKCVLFTVWKLYPNEADLKINKVKS